MFVVSNGGSRSRLSGGGGMAMFCRGSKMSSGGSGGDGRGGTRGGVHRALDGCGSDCDYGGGCWRSHGTSTSQDPKRNYWVVYGSVKFETSLQSSVYLKLKSPVGKMVVIKKIFCERVKLTQRLAKSFMVPAAKQTTH